VPSAPVITPQIIKVQITNKSTNRPTHPSYLKTSRKKLMSSYTSNSLLLLLFNSNGLKNHSNELQLVLQEKRIDIALISETHFTKYAHIPIPCYQLLKTNHPDNSAHGGAAIYIKSSLSFQNLPNFCQPHLQSCAVLLHLNNIPTTLAAIYSPPRHNINIQNYIDYFSTFSHNFIIGGDFNA